MILSKLKKIILEQKDATQFFMSDEDAEKQKNDVEKNIRTIAINNGYEIEHCKGGHGLIVQ